MDNYDEEFFQQLLKEKEQEKLQDDSEEIKELFEKAIQSSIYDYYTPKYYNRNYTFLNSVVTHLDIENNTLYVYSDINEGDEYYSAVDMSPQFQNINNWLEDGHSDGIGIKVPKFNQYHEFEGRNFLEKAEELIKEQFPDYNIKIIKDNENDEYEFFND